MIPYSRGQIASYYKKETFSLNPGVGFARLETAGEAGGRRGVYVELSLRRGKPAGGGTGGRAGIL